MSVLLELARSPGEVVTRQQLLDRIWTGVIVTDDAVTRCISELRTAFADDRQAPRYVQTLPKRGYRLLVAPAELDEPEPAQSSAPALLLAARTPVAHPHARWSLRFVTRGRLAPAGAIVAVVLAAGAALWLARGSPAGEQPTPSIAILPFTLAGPAESQMRYFSEGLAEELVNALVRVDGLRVASRAASFPQGQDATDPLAFARALGVDAVLTGTLRRTGSRLRVAAQLVDAGSGFHLWAQTYDRGIDDVFAMQDDIATEVAAALGVEPHAPIRVARISTNMQAFDYYLLGRHHWNQRSPESLERAVDFFSQAIDVDPGLARAYAGLADSYLLLASYGDFPPDEAEVRASRAIERALRLNPELPEAHASQGILLTHLEDFVGAEAALRRAVELDAFYPMGLMWLANAVKAQWRIGESLELYRRAQAIDPTHPVLRHNLVNALLAAGDYRAAESLLRASPNGAESADGAPVIARMDAMLELELAMELGRLDDAAERARALLGMPDAQSFGYLALSAIARARGDPAEAYRWLDTAETKARPRERELYFARLELDAETGDQASFEATMARWRADAETGPPELESLELGLNGLLELRRADYEKAVTYLESALASTDEKSSYPPMRLRWLGHLLLAYGALNETREVDRCRRLARTEMAAARSLGFGSMPFQLEAAYALAAAG